MKHDTWGYKLQNKTGNDETKHYDFFFLQESVSAVHLFDLKNVLMYLFKHTVYADTDLWVIG